MILDMAISRSSALSINVLLIFEMHDLKRALFSNATFFSASSFSFAAAVKRSSIPFTIMNASLQSYQTDLKIEVLNLIVLLTED